jgi:hypothetical protein
MASIQKLIIELYNKECLYFKKNTNMTFIYIDYNHIIMHNYLINNIIEEIYLKIRFLDFSIIASTTKTSIVFSSILANKYNYTHIFLKESKNSFNYLKSETPIKGLLFIDKITEENDILKYIRQLNKNNIKVIDIFVINYNKKTEILNQYTINYLFSDYDVFKLMKINNIISESMFNNIIKSYYPILTNKLYYTYEDIYRNSKISIIRKLCNIMIKKKTNICINFENCEIKRMLEILGKIAKHICMIEIDSTLISSNVIVNSLNKLSEELEFIIILNDSKYSKLVLKNCVNIMTYPNIDITKINKPCILNYSNNISNQTLKEQFNELYSIDLYTLINNNNNIVGFKSDNILISNFHVINICNSINVYNSYDTNYKNIHLKIVTEKYNIVNLTIDDIYDDIEETINNCKIIGWTSYMENNYT